MKFDNDDEENEKEVFLWLYTIIFARMFNREPARIA